MCSVAGGGVSTPLMIAPTDINEPVSALDEEQMMDIRASYAEVKLRTRTKSGVSKKASFSLQNKNGKPRMWAECITCQG